MLDEVVEVARLEVLLGAFLWLGCEPQPAMPIAVATMAMAAPLIAVRFIELLLSLDRSAEA
jgi:hypothetical protein